MPKQTLLLIISLLIAGCATTEQYAPPETVDGLRTQYEQFNRVSAISHNILVANAPICSKTREDYGFTYMSVSQNVDEAKKKIWIETFHLHEQPTVTFVVPNSMADRAGLRANDVIIAVNDERWADAKSTDAFTKQLSEAQKSPHLRLGILRDGKEQTLNLTEDHVCDYSFTLNMANEHLTWAQDNKIVVDLGVAKLLKRNDELAFVISHELAHILLGHTLPERTNELDDYNMRSAMEKDADALGIRLMTHAGYDPDGAETALKSIDLIDSGPITRFFNYHGSYMPTDERISYLRKVLNE